jgi:hypothetical protein
MHFTLWLGSFYCLYYLVIIFTDLLTNRQRASDESQTPELTFVEAHQPFYVEEKAGESPGAAGGGTDQPSTVMLREADLQQITSPLIASGGITLKEAEDLARREVIEFTRLVSF